MDLSPGSVASLVLLLASTAVWAYCDRGHIDATPRPPATGSCPAAPHPSAPPPPPVPARRGTPLAWPELARRRARRRPARADGAARQ